MNKGEIMEYQATAKFKELGIENCYQFLTIKDYQDFMRGKIVKIDNPPKHLIEGKYIEKVKKTGVSKNGN